MAKEDYVVADRNTDALEAGDKIKEVVAETPEDGVEGTDFQSPYVDYADALEAHESRADIEPLSARRAREYGTSFSDADFMRAAAYNSDGTAAAAPRPGTIHGDAPKDA